MTILILAFDADIEAYMGMTIVSVQVFLKKETLSSVTDIVIITRAN